MDILLYLLIAFALVIQTMTLENIFQRRLKEAIAEICEDSDKEDTK